MTNARTLTLALVLGAVLLIAAIVLFGGGVADELGRRAVESGVV